MLDSSLGNSAQATIPLQTINGLTGYSITKFEIMPNQPGAVGSEGVVKIYKTPQSTIDALIDFDDNRLLAAAFYTQSANVSYTSNALITIFESEKFNQDIYVVYDEIGGTDQFMNYYIELEQMDLNLDEATVATLKDIRNND